MKLNLHKNLFLPKFLNRLLMYKINLKIFILGGFFFFARIRALCNSILIIN